MSLMHLPVDEDGLPVASTGMETSLTITKP
jgi:hypothetical protein